LGHAFAGALLLFASASRAETSLVLDCKPDPVSGARDKDPIVSVAVSVNGLKWRATHLAASGKRYERAEQYGLHDASDQNAPARTWQGTLINRPFLKMVGQIQRAGDNFTYVETLYDARKSGAKTMELKFSCVSAGTPQPITSAQPYAPEAPSKATNMSTSECSAVTDQEQRLACYNKVAECSALTDPRQRFVCYEGLARAERQEEASKIEPKFDITHPNVVIHGDCLYANFPGDFPTAYRYCLNIFHGESNSENARDRGSHYFALAVASNGSVQLTSGDHANEVFDKNGRTTREGRITLWRKGRPSTNGDGILVQDINSTTINLPESFPKFTNEQMADGYAKWFIESAGTCAWREQFGSTDVVVCDVDDVGRPISFCVQTRRIHSRGRASALLAATPGDPRGLQPSTSGTSSSSPAIASARVAGRPGRV
jgi:hypothetical protein